MSVTLIVAHDKNYLIGKDNQIPWANKDDMYFFKKTTINHAVIMGRKTWESLPKKPLPERLNLIISKQPNYGKYNVLPSLEKAIAFGEKVGKLIYKTDEVFIIGGAKIYQYALENNLIDKVIANEIPGEYTGDTYLPEIFKNLTNPQEIYNEKSKISTRIYRLR